MRNLGRCSLEKPAAMPLEITNDIEEIFSVMASGIGKLPKGHNPKERYYILHMKKGAEF